MSEVIVKNPWVVEVAEREHPEASYVGQPYFGRGAWQFSRAFVLESDAMAYAKRYAEDNEWVRVVYRDV